MLRRLTVKNYAIIRDLDMEFGEGFTIITGETGAGKSILLGALGLVLGERADTSVLLSKDEKCIVEAHFNVKGYDMEDLFESSQIDYDDNAIMRREINPAGKSRAFINDTPVNLNVMKDVGERLIDIHSQHQTLLLGNSLFQMRVTDAFAGTSALYSNYSHAYRRYLRLRIEYEEAAGAAERDRADFEYYSHQLEQFQAAKLVQGEQEELEHEQEVLSNAGVISEALSAASSAMAGEDLSALALLREVRNNLAKIAGWMPAAGELEKRIGTSLVELNDISYETEKLLGAASTDPGRLEFVTQRLDTIYSLEQKHRCRDLAELLVKQAEIENRVSESAGIDDRIESLRKSAEDALQSSMQLARDLSAGRKKAAGPLSDRITGMLHDLGMPNARFETRISGLDVPGSGGIDRIDFLFSANRQVPPEELSRVASGGELSRVMLCLKSTLASSSGLPAIVFDEIDSGVSGEVASMVGTILAEMGKAMQVINITHLPQVASKGKVHYHVYKEENDHSTITRVKLLNHDERLTEVARLLSGSKITDAALRNARELLAGK
jgi:DNA repair protein RecN (Recombination protein N)